MTSKTPQGNNRYDWIKPHMVIDAYVESGYNLSATGEKLGVSRQTVRRHLEKAQIEGYEIPDTPTSGEELSEFETVAKPQESNSSGFIAPEIPTDKMETPELIDHLCSRFTKRQQSEKAKKWMPFDITLEGPIALAFVGDPHLDDNGCNWPLIKRDVELIRDTEGMFGIGMGDYTNNWSGALSLKKHPYQETTRPQAWQLAEWFFQTVSWLILIKGNHDLWSTSHGTGDPLDWIHEGPGRMEDWEAQFRLRFKNGREIKVWAAHDFKGNSQWNNLHGPMKKAQMTGVVADIYVAGDKHNWGMYQNEDADQGKVYWALRCRGYKYIDEYSKMLGFDSQQHGATIVAVIDPDETGPTGIQCFSDVKVGAEYLKWKRAIWRSKNVRQDAQSGV